jgi:hypothetical protein
MSKGGKPWLMGEAQLGQIREVVALFSLRFRGCAEAFQDVMQGAHATRFDGLGGSLAAANGGQSRPTNGLWRGCDWLPTIHQT